MRIPNVLSSLVDEGVIERVVRPLMSGKEAQIYLVVAGGIDCVAKIYKEADNRTFKHRADYTEGRKVRNSRDQRAINKRSQHGRSQDEAAWRSTEVDMIYRLRAAGVRVPAPYHFIDGVLVMELVSDANGDPAARLGEIDFAPAEAKAIYGRLIQDVVRMLCAGVVHGDLSDFNVLLGADGPVIIDFPQAVDPSKNQNARKLLLRDVENLHRFYSKFAPDEPRAPYAEEMWALYESNRLTPETRLRGQYRASQRKANVTELMDFIGEVNEDERRRRRAQGRDSSAIPAPPRRADSTDARRSPAGGAKPVAARGRAAPLPARPAPGTQAVAARGRAAPLPVRPAPHAQGVAARGRPAPLPRPAPSTQGVAERGRAAPLPARPAPSARPVDGMRAAPLPARPAPSARSVADGTRAAPLPVRPAPSARPASNARPIADGTGREPLARPTPRARPVAAEMRRDPLPARPADGAQPVPGPGPARRRRRRKRPANRSAAPSAS
ncbi:MAG: PA4780 family RIO1-like protein kinase [Deltaproteobacteria bacterium]